MNTLHFKAILWGMAIAILTSCSLNLKSTPALSDAKSTEKDKKNNQSIIDKDSSNKQANHYYYFIEATLYKKKGAYAKAAKFIEKAVAHDQESLFLKRELSVLYLKLKDHKKALTVIDEILSIDASDVDSLIMYGSIKQTLKQNDEAKIAFEKVLKLDPKREQIYLMLGRLYLEDEAYVSAKKIYGRLIDTFPTSYAGHYFLGRIYVMQRQLDQAEKAFKKTIKIEPELIEPRFELISLLSNETEEFKIIEVKKGDTLSSLCKKVYNDYNKTIYNKVLSYNKSLKATGLINIGQQLRFPNLMFLKDRNKRAQKKKEIITLYKEILEIYPENIRATMELGLYYYTHNMKTKGIKLFKDLGKRSLLELNVNRNIVQLLIDQKKYNDAVIVLTHMLEAASKNFEIHYLLGIAYDGLKKTNLAIDHFQKVDPDNRFYQNAVVHAAFLLQEAGRHDEAIVFLDDAIDKEPKNINFLLYLGSVYEEIEQLQKAQEIFKKGISIDAKNTKLHFRLGVVYDKWGKKEASIEQMKTIIKLDPKHANALNYLGYTYADLGKNLDEAEVLVKKALKYKPNDGYITDSLGWVYYKKGMIDEAIKYLEKAISLITDDPILLEHLGDAYLKKGNSKKALEFFKRAILTKEDDKSELERKIKAINAIAENHK